MGRLLNFACLVLCLVALSAHAQDAKDQPLTAFPYQPSLDVASMDRTADPCVDFYRFSCGGWIANNPIPADQSSWSVYGKLYQDNQRFLWGILQTLAQPGATRTPVQAQIGDYFAACMDEAAIEAKGLTPAMADLDAVAALTAKKDLPALLARLHSHDVDAYFGFGADQDLADSEQMIAVLGAGGLGLPDRDYYTKTDKHSKETRAQYWAHVTRIFELAGADKASAKLAANSVMTTETSLARASLTNVEQRDPYKLFHNMDPKKLQALTPHFEWGPYLAALGAPPLDHLNASQPKFLAEVDRLIATGSLADIKTYLRWQVLHQAAAHLTSSFVTANFDFYGKVLRGTPQMPPRWKRCVGLVDHQLGDALSQEFIARTFSPKLKADTLRMTQQIETAMGQEISQLDWMSAETKAKALEKLHAVAAKIGYPDTWRDYSSVTIKADDFFGNVERATLFEEKRQLAKIGKPVDRSEWQMSAATVNAYYNPQMNDINFPAGVLQPPLYDPKIDAAPNYGNTGGTIGHELTHGFDDEGRQFDGKGNLKDWWTKADAEGFKKRAQCVVDQYGKYTAVDELKIKSELTQGEDIADLGGLVIAWIAWKAEVADKQLSDVDGLTPEQRFFVGNAQWACAHERPEVARLHALTNPHSPERYRVNGLVVNMPEFQTAFQCKAGQPMVSENRCKIW